MSYASSAILPHFLPSLLTDMVVALIEWDIYFTDMKRDQKKIPLQPLIESAIIRAVYFNVLTVFFGLYCKLTLADFIKLRRHSDSLFYLLRMAKSLEGGIKAKHLAAELEKDRTSELHPTGHRRKNADATGTTIPEQIKTSRFALYVSGCGEKALQTMIRKAANSGELIAALEEAETFTAQGTVLRIWYGSFWNSPIIPVLREFLGKAPEDDYKSIVSHPEGDVTEAGLFYGPLRLMSFQDLDYDLSQADGTDWLCRSCSELDNDFTDHGFIRDWNAEEELGKNGHTRRTQLTQHVNGEIRCKACGCYNVIDQKTGKEVNSPS